MAAAAAPYHAPAAVPHAPWLLTLILIFGSYEAIARKQALQFIPTLLIAAAVTGGVREIHRLVS
jgi:hypothetical protein